jgi:putative flippase GtrA
MNCQSLKTPQVKGIIPGITVAVMLTALRIPPAFALVVGIIFGTVAFFVLNENKTEWAP